MDAEPDPGGAPRSRFSITGGAGGLGRFFIAGCLAIPGPPQLQPLSLQHCLSDPHGALDAGFGIVHSHPLEWGIVLAIPILAAAIVTAHFSEAQLERPSIALGRRLTQFSIQPSPNTAAAPA